MGFVGKIISKLTQLFDVTITSPTTGQALIYNSVSGKWENGDIGTQGEIDAHIADTTTHGTTGDIVGTSDVQTLTNKTINADSNSISNIENSDIKSGAAIDAAKIHDGTVSNTEYGYLNGVSSAIQTQIDSKVTDSDPLSVEWTGTPISPIIIEFVNQWTDAVLDGVGTGSPVTVPTVTGVGFRQISYVEHVASGDHLQSFALHNGVFCSVGITFSGCFEVTSIEFPELRYVMAGGVTLSTCPLLTTVDLSELRISTGGLVLSALSALVSIDLGNLIAVHGAFSPGTCTSLITLSAPLLTYIGSSFTPNNLSVCTSISVPELVYVGGTFGPSSCPLCTTLTATSLERVASTVNVALAAITTLDLPALVNVGGSFSPTNCTVCTSISCPSLETVGATFSFTTFPALTSVDFSSLTTVSGNFTPSTCASLTTMTFPALTTVSGTVTVATMGAMTSISLPVLASCTTIIMSSMANLTTLTMPSLVSCTTVTMTTSLGNLTNVTLGAVGTTMIINGNVTITNQKLTQASVDGILAVLASLDGTNGTTSWGTGKTVNLSGGTSSTPSAAGLVSKGIIVARGGTVTHN